MKFKKTNHSYVALSFVLKPLLGDFCDKRNKASDLLKKYNLNALELEQLTGVPASTIYRLLKDKSGNPTIDILKKLSSFFQITVSQLIGEDPIGCKQIPLIQPLDIHSFFKSPQNRGIESNTIPIDFPFKQSGRRPARQAKY